MSEPYTPTTEEMIDAYVQQALAESGEKDPLKRLVLAVGFEAEADRWRAALTEPTEADREALVDLLVMTPMADWISGLAIVSRTADALLAAGVRFVGDRGE